MAHTYTNLAYHFVFSTKDRTPLITNDLKPRLYGYISGIIADPRGETMAIGGVEDHVHILCRLKTDVTIADAMRQIKGSSSKWVNDEIKLQGKFAWQTGYAAFSVSQSKMESAVRYIGEKEEHHRKRSFKEGLVDFLNVNGVEYNEQHLWT